MKKDNLLFREELLYTFSIYFLLIFVSPYSALSVCTYNKNLLENEIFHEFKYFANDTNERCERDFVLNIKIFLMKLRQRRWSLKNFV